MPRFMFLPVICVTLAALGCGPKPTDQALQPVAPTALTPRQMREEDLRELEGLIRRAYAYVDEKKADAGVDLDALFADARMRLDGVTSDADFHDLLKEVVAGLKDGHCEVYAGHLVAPLPRAWPVVLNPVKEGMIVTDLRLAPGDSGVARGDLVLAVNGRPIGEWVAAAARKVSASSDESRQRMALRRMTATADESVALSIERPDGTTATVTVMTVPGFAEPAAPAFAAGRVLDGGVGYIRIPSFAPPADFHRASTDADRNAALQPVRDQVDAAFKAVAGTRGLVLDLRGNGGGSDLLGAYVVSHLVSGDFLYYTTQTRSSADLRRTPGFGHLPAADGWAARSEWRPRKTVFSLFAGEPYQGRVVVLIDERCFSATDCATHALADLRPAVRFVGRPAGGGAGGPTVVGKLPHSRADVQLNVMRVWGPEGRLIEGHGTRPGVSVEWGRDDVLKGRDPDVQAAAADLGR